MANELQKGMSFAIKLMPRQQLPGATALSTSLESGMLEDSTALAIVLSYEEADKPKTIWRHEKFMNRLYIMREMYQNFLQLGGSMQYTQEEDPFWDPPEDLLLGRARIQLEALGYCMDTGDDWTPLVDYKGQQEGELLVKIVPTSKEVALEDLDELDQLQGRCLQLKVGIEAARGLNPILKGRYSSIYTKFSFFNHQSELDLTVDSEDSSGVYNSPHFPLTSVNLLRLDYQATLTQMVTADFVRYLASSALEVDLWASCEHDQPESVDIIGLGSDGSNGDDVEHLRAQNTQLRSENEILQQKVVDLESELAEWRSGQKPKPSRTRTNLETAQQMDEIYS